MEGGVGNSSSSYYSMTTCADNAQQGDEVLLCLEQVDLKLVISQIKHSLQQFRQEPHE